MKQFARWLKKHLGVVVVAVFLVIHLAVINDYGFTWDFHFHFFGAAKLLGYEWWQVEPRPLPYVEPDPRKAAILPYGPLMSIPPFASWLIFYKTLRWLPEDSAYHLPIVLWGVGGIGILFFFLKEAVSTRVALMASLFLALLPRYFGDLHNNMKDVPNAAIFALNVWLLWRLARYRRLRDLLWAALAFAIAFNIKVNSIYLPVIFAAWLLLRKILNPKSPSTSLGAGKIQFLYFIVAPAFALLLWSLFWTDPIGQLKHAVSTFGGGTLNIEVLLNGQWYCSSKNVPWYYPYWYLAITTPLPVLLLFFIGLAGFTKHHELNTKLLLLLWFFLPLSRYLVPQIGVIDGIRHFEEVVYPLAALAALGAENATHWIMNRCFLPRLMRLSSVFVLFLFSIFYLLFTIVSYHPFQITYFNELVGGVRGAFGKYDLDYWGTSQKQAMAWINKYAPPGSKVRVVMASDVAARYLREDLFSGFNQLGNDTSDFVVILNRQSFFYRFHYTYEYLLTHQPTATVSVDGVPLVWIFDNRTDNKTPRQTPWWQDEDPCIIKYWRSEEL